MDVTLDPGGLSVAVTISVLDAGKMLMVQEKRPDVYGQWTIPGGRIEYGEDILAAACREAKEETGFDVALHSTTGVYTFVSALSNYVVMFHFLGTIVGETRTQPDADINDVRWVALDELQRWPDDTLRHPAFIRCAVQRVAERLLFPLTVFGDGGGGATSLDTARGAPPRREGPSA